jgi:hypothetical protein
MIGTVASSRRRLHLAPAKLILPILPRPFGPGNAAAAAKTTPK